MNGMRLTFLANWLPKLRRFVPISRGEAVVVPLACFLAGYTGPFGTYSLGLGSRLPFWTLVIVTSVLMGAWCRGLSHRLVSPRRPWLQDVVTVGLMTVSFGPVLIGLCAEFLSAKVSSLTDALPYLQFVAIISLCVTSSRRIIMRRRQAATPDPEAGEVAAAAVAAESALPEPAPQPRLMRRLPEGFAGPILRLTVEDHFVDVIAPQHRHRLRLRFADAVDEMDPVAGFYTHRSHWVARDAVDRLEREGGRLLVVLINGDRVPVSRTYRPQVEQAA